jgi:hypothetical protein
MSEMSCVREQAISTIKNMAHDTYIKLIDIPMKDIISEFDPPIRLLIQHYYAIKDLRGKFPHIEMLESGRFHLSLISYMWSIGNWSSIRNKNTVYTPRICKLYNNIVDVSYMAEVVLKPMRNLQELNSMAKDFIETTIYLQQKFNDELHEVILKSKEMWERMEKNSPILRTIDG